MIMINMKRYIKILGLFLALWTIAGIMTSCSKESLSGGGPEPSAPVTATFSLRLAGDFGTTRSLNPDDEHTLKTADIISFRKDASDNEYFFYREHATMVEGEGTPGGKKFRSSIRYSDDPQQFVIFANARETLDALSLNPTMTRQQVLDRISMAQSGAWDVSANYDPLPMWGQSDYMTIDDGDPELSVELIRSVARIDVNIASTAQDDGFVMKKVLYYNYPDKGRLSPLDANWNSAGKRVTAPSAPQGGYTYATTPQEHTVTGGKSLQRAVYSFETTPAASNSDQAASCLIIGGSWKGGPDSYYRVDFFDGTTKNYLPLLRNYHYDVQVTAVKGPGYPRPADALKAGFSNMTAITHKWEQGGMGNVVWDGHNMLSVSRNEFEIYPEEQILEVEAATTFSEGWKATVSIDPADGADWLTIDGSGTGVGNEAVGTLKLKAKVNALRDRTGTVTITAGRLTQTVTVLQRLQPELSLEVGDVELIFATNPAEQELRVEWNPAAKNCKVELLPVSGYTALAFTTHPLPATISNDGSSSAHGVRSLKVQPDNASLATFAERRSILRITAYDVNNTAIYKDILLRQFDYALTIGGTINEYHFGTTYNLTVKSNALWEVESSDPGMVSVTSQVKGQENHLTGGEVIEFKTGHTAGASTLTFKSNEGLFADYSVTINLERLAPNCYIVPPGTTDFKFSTSSAFKAWREYGDLKDHYATHMTGVQTVELLWQDEPGLITTQPILEGDQIKLSTNSGNEGNAVIALKIDGVIRWSWHIWITGFDPEVGTYQNPNTGAISMDRNIGATSATLPANGNDVSSFGLLYQHGRKDPFLGAATATGVTIKTKYDIQGNILTDNAANGFGREEVSVPINLINAIAKPSIFYTHTTVTVYGESQDWYTSDHASAGVSPNHRWNLWPGSKSYFDPCPEGWRVPKRGEVWERLMPPAGMAEIAANKGIVTPYGTFPAVAYRNEYGGLVQQGSLIYFYNANQPGDYWGSHYRLTSLIFATYGGNSKTMGFSVRCVKVQ